MSRRKKSKDDSLPWIPESDAIDELRERVERLEAITDKQRKEHDDLITRLLRMHGLDVGRIQV